MKKFKFSFFAAIAIVLGFVASSFTVQHKAHTSMNWYEFVGTDPTSANDYQLLSAEPGCISDPDQVCAVQADEGSSGKPDQDELNSIYSGSSHFTQPAANLKYRESQ